MRKPDPSHCSFDPKSERRFEEHLAETEVLRRAVVEMSERLSEILHATNVTLDLDECQLVAEGRTIDVQWRDGLDAAGHTVIYGASDGAIGRTAAILANLESGDNGVLGYRGDLIIKSQDLDRVAGVLARNNIRPEDITTGRSEVRIWALTTILNQPGAEVTAELDKDTHRWSPMSDTVS